MTSGSAWNPCCPHKNLRPDAPRVIIAASSTGCWGLPARAHRGVIYRSGMALLARCPAGSTAGVKRVSGTVSWPPYSSRLMPMASLIGTCILSMAPVYARISTRLVQKRGSSNRSVGAQSGRLLHQNPSAGRRWGQTADLSRDGGAAPRSGGIRTPDGAGGGGTSRPRMTQTATQARGWRQRVSQQADTAVPAAPWHSHDDPAQNQ